MLCCEKMNSRGRNSMDVPPSPNVYVCEAKMHKILNSVHSFFAIESHLFDVFYLFKNWPISIYRLLLNTLVSDWANLCDTHAFHSIFCVFFFFAFVDVHLFCSTPITAAVFVFNPTILLFGMGFVLLASVATILFSTNVVVRVRTAFCWVMMLVGASFYSVSFLTSCLVEFIRWNPECSLD